MTPLQYLIEKNIAVNKRVRRTLIPKRQLVDIPVTKRMIKQMEAYLEIEKTYTPKGHFSPLIDENCPYCAYFANPDNLDCGDCPMQEAGNKCSIKGSTFQNVRALVEKSKLKKDRLTKDLVALTKKFLKANKEA